MARTGRPALELPELLRQFRSAAHRDPVAVGDRFRAVTVATSDWFNADFVANASDGSFGDAVEHFYRACVRSAWHAAAIRQHLGSIRGALGFALTESAPAARLLDQCLRPGGEFFVAGLGPAFWSAVCQALAPDTAPAWTPEIVAGLTRLGRWLPPPTVRPSIRYVAIMLANAHIRRYGPGLSVFDVDRFLTFIGTELHQPAPRLATVKEWADACRHRTGRARLSFSAGQGLARLDDAITGAPPALRLTLAEQAVRSLADAHGLSHAGAVAVLEAAGEHVPSLVVR